VAFFAEDAERADGVEADPTVFVGDAQSDGFHVVGAEWSRLVSSPQPQPRTVLSELAAMASADAFAERGGVDDRRCWLGFGVFRAGSVADVDG